MLSQAGVQILNTERIFCTPSPPEKKSVCWQLVNAHNSCNTATVKVVLCITCHQSELSKDMSAVGCSDTVLLSILHAYTCRADCMPVHACVYAMQAVAQMGGAVQSRPEGTGRALVGIL